MKVIYLFFICILMISCAPEGAQVYISTDVANIENEQVKVSFDLKNGYLQIINKQENRVIVDSACFSANQYYSTDFSLFKAHAEDTHTGKKLFVTACSPEIDLTVESTVMNNSPEIKFNMQIFNHRDGPLHIKQWSPVRGGRLFASLGDVEEFHILDGNAGGEPTWTYQQLPVYCRNNMLVTAKSGNKRHTFVAGGLTYQEYEKFVEVTSAAPRREQLEKLYPEMSLFAYMNVPVMREDGLDPYISLGKGYDYEQPSAPAFEIRKAVYDSQEIIVNLMNPEKGKKYAMGVAISSDSNNRKESLWADNGPGSIAYELSGKISIDNFNEGGKSTQVIVNLPQELTDKGNVRLLLKKDEGPNAVLNEVWAYEGHISGNDSGKASTFNYVPNKAGDFRVSLFAQDPLGKLIDSQQNYSFKDKFYLDITTHSHFEALEKYAFAVKNEQGININYYDFPSVCLWYAMHPYYGMGPGMNSSKGAVEEMERISRSGFLKYAKAAVRLVPDCYEVNNEQGWWDDKHFQMHGSGNAVPGEVNVKQHYEKPYETTVKWATAVERLGGIPLLYVQTGKRSQDYAEAYPEHMLFNQSDAYIPDFTWTVGAKASYDFTDKGFVTHMKEVYKNFKEGGLKGLMFDYTNTGWPQYGGLDDPYSTAAAAYRKIYELAYEGMGKDSYIHERCLERGSDITLGTVSSQRIWGDTDDVTPEMVMRGGLRWYKNRVVVSYDMDAKNLLKAKPVNHPDGRRKLLTMCYVTSARLLLANSFERYDSLTLWDLGRIYPFHHTAQSARPIDMLQQDIPHIYDFKVNEDWHQVTFYNDQNDKELKITVNLFDPQEEGGLGLDSVKSYYAYDFWNDCFLGKLAGKELQQVLRPGEARMLSIRAVADNPQVVSCNRHIMQGYLELEDISSTNELLEGKIMLPKDEFVEIAIALNGKEIKNAICNEAQLQILPISENLVKLQFYSIKNQQVAWKVHFQPSER